MTDSENLIITAPNITPGEVKNLLGNDKMSVADVCLSPNINEWSRYKPIYKVGRTGIDFHFRGVGYDASLHGLVAKSYPNWMQLANTLVVNGKLQTPSDWSYDQSQLKKNSIPKRLGDFDGYYHNAAPPFAGFSCPSVMGNKTAGSQQKAYLLPAIKTDIGADDLVAPGSIGLSQINAPSVANIATTTLNNFYFGVALISPQNATVAWAMSENAIQDVITGEIAHTYEVPMSLTSVTAGTYFAVPILTRVRVTSLQDTPQQICIVPNCSPIQVTVTDSSTVNEDLEVAFTECKYIASVGDDTNGFVRSVIRAENTGSYTKRCTYTAYTTLNGGTTQLNVQTGEFNLAPKGSYSFVYSIIASIQEARGTVVYVSVSANRDDGISTQTITATRVPIVPMPDDSELS